MLTPGWYWWTRFVGATPWYIYVGRDNEGLFYEIPWKERRETPFCAPGDFIIVDKVYRRRDFIGQFIQGASKMEPVENPMIKNCLWPEPCRSEAVTFYDYILENYSLEEVLAISGVMEALIKMKMEDYKLWLKE